MKLKKIASLMLAGVMAVSMLAGCKSGTGDATTPDDDGTVVVPETGIAAAFNNGQNKNNDAKVKFSDDANLDAILAQVVADLKDGANSDDLNRRLKSYINVGIWDYDTTSKKTTSNNFYNDDDLKKLDKDGDPVEKVDPVTLLFGMVIDSDQAWTEENALKIAVSNADKAIATYLVSDSVEDPDQMHKDDAYHVYDYTGNVSMVSEKNADGTTSYYFAFVVTQTITYAEFEV